MLNTIERSQNRGHLGQFEVVDVDIHVQLYNPLQSGFLLIKLREEGPQDTLTDALICTTAVQMQCVGNEITEVAVPNLWVLFFSFQRIRKKTLLFRLKMKGKKECYI